MARSPHQLNRETKQGTHNMLAIIIRNMVTDKQCSSWWSPVAVSSEVTRNTVTGFSVSPSVLLTIKVTFPLSPHYPSSHQP